MITTQKRKRTRMQIERTPRSDLWAIYENGYVYRASAGYIPEKMTHFETQIWGLGRADALAGIIRSWEDVEKLIAHYTRDYYRDRTGGLR